MANQAVALSLPQIHADAAVAVSRSRSMLLGLAEIYEGWHSATRQPDVEAIAPGCTRSVPPVLPCLDNTACVPLAPPMRTRPKKGWQQMEPRRVSASREGASRAESPFVQAPRVRTPAT